MQLLLTGYSWGPGRAWRGRGRGVTYSAARQRLQQQVGHCAVQQRSSPQESHPCAAKRTAMVQYMMQALIE